MKFKRLSELQLDLANKRDASTSEYWEAMGKCMGADEIAVLIEPLILAARESLNNWEECLECGVQDMWGEHEEVDPPFFALEQGSTLCSLGELRNALVNLPLEKEE